MSIHLAFVSQEEVLDSTKRVFNESLTWESVGEYREGASQSTGQPRMLRAASVALIKSLAPEI
jgi:hypothetical protein